MTARALGATPRKDRGLHHRRHTRSRSGWRCGPWSPHQPARARARGAPNSRTVGSRRRWPPRRPCPSRTSHPRRPCCHLHRRRAAPAPAARRSPGATGSWTTGLPSGGQACLHLRATQIQRQQLPPHRLPTTRGTAARRTWARGPRVPRVMTTRTPPTRTTTRVTAGAARRKEAAKVAKGRAMTGGGRRARARARAAGAGPGGARRIEFERGTSTYISP
mmetsp:Transcript_66796/g.184993  ORF Transcript_66796/g.184993 Transcript_66796/m.184993 type:complete len:219 (+) Transcript_66796:1518-2174(+)